jgi:hypothetical protein
VHPIVAAAIANEISAARIHAAGDHRIRRTRPRFPGLRSAVARRRAAPPSAPGRPVPVRAGR